MVKKISWILFSLVIYIFSNAEALAVPITIDFTSGNYSTAAPGAQNVYTESGFTFATPVALNNHFDSSPAGPVTRPFLIFHEAANNTVNNIITLSFGGLGFDFLSFDLVFDQAILALNPLINPPMTVLASDGSMLTTPLGAPPGFTGTISPGWMGVTFVTFDIVGVSSTSGNVLLDNVAVEPSFTQAVPEPNILSIFIVGLVLVGFLIRRRNGIAC